jgi:hypothetical protein
MLMASFRWFSSVLAGALLLSAGAAARAEVPTGQPVDGIHCDSMEGAVMHIHQHLTIYDHGKAFAVPADIGIPVASSCLYWLHTHTPDGLIHVESPNMRSFNLGQFFDIWGQPLTPTNVAEIKVKKGQVRAYVNENLYKDNPRTIDLLEHSDIVLEVGPPYHVPAQFKNWNGN